MKKSKDNHPIWIGGLPIGRDWDSKYTVNIFHSLPKNKDYVIDVADIYSKGKALDILSEISEEIPNNVFISFKYGLVACQKSDYFKVVKREFKNNDFEERVLSFFDKVGFNKMHSVQLHAFPKSEDSLKVCIRVLKSLKNNFNNLKIGLSNVEIYEVKDFLNHFAMPIFIQLHGNILEQRLINEFRNEYKEDISFVINRVLCRGLLTNPKRFLSDPKSRFSTSERVKNSLSKEKKDFINFIYRFAKKNGSSVERIALAWFKTLDCKIYPILGARTNRQLNSSLQILNSISRDDIEIANYVSKKALEIENLEVNKYPYFALEL